MNYDRKNLSRLIPVTSIPMSRSTDAAFVQEQYATSANLDARIALHEKFSTASEHFHDWYFKHVDLYHARVLEIGCGSGALWQRVYAKIPHAWNLTLTDYSFGMAAQTRHNLQSLAIAHDCPPGSNSLNATAKPFPFPTKPLTAFSPITCCITFRISTTRSRKFAAC